MFFQIWSDFDENAERFRKTLYYGRIPSSDRFSLPVTGEFLREKVDFSCDTYMLLSFESLRTK